MRTSMLVFAALLSGCWKLDDEIVDYGLIAMDNEFVDVDVLIETVPTTLACPDGEYAEFYMVYRSDIQDDPPVALVFHSGGFDYVENPSFSDPLDGRHFRDSEDRLRFSWASTRIFGVFGMWGSDELDKNEYHTGALPAVLAKQGVLAIYPPNCWGDLWHNEQSRQTNNENEDGYYRNGRTMAWWMTRMFLDEEFALGKNITFPVSFSQAPEITLLGLGDGGRAVVELLWRLKDGPVASDPDFPLYDDDEEPLLPERISGVLLDCTPDDLAPYESGYGTQVYDSTGLDRIFYGGDASISEWSLLNYLSLVDPDEWPEHIAFYWSEADPRMVNSAVEETVTYLEALRDDTSGEYTDRIIVENMLTSDHVYTNNDITITHSVVNFLYE